MQLSGGDEVGVEGAVAPAGGLAALDELLPPPLDPLDPPAPAADPPPEQTPVTLGWQAKAGSPQSASALQGSCQRKAQTDVVVVVHVGSDFTGAAPASQTVLGGQAGVVVPAPPEQLVLDCVLQTMPVPQSVSAWQLLGSHELTTVVVGAPASPFEQSWSGAHAGVGTATVMETHA